MAKKSAKKQASKKAATRRRPGVRRSTPAAAVDSPEASAKSERAELEELRNILLDLLEQFRGLGVGQDPGAHNANAEADQEMIPFYITPQFEQLRGEQMRRASRLIDRHVWEGRKPPGPLDRDRARLRRNLNWDKPETVEAILAFVDDRLASLVDASPAPPVSSPKRLAAFKKLLAGRDGSRLRAVYATLPISADGEGKWSAPRIGKKVGKQDTRWSASPSSIRRDIAKLRAALGSEIQTTKNKGAQSGSWKTIDRLPELGI